MHLRDHLLPGLAALGALALATYACSSSPQRPAQPRISATRSVVGITADDRTRREVTGRVDREVQESMGPGSSQPNIRRIFGVVGSGDEQRKVLLCREVDTNLDGVKDVVRTYNDKGEPINELADTNFDGRVDTWVSFTRGRVAKVQVDHNANGEPDETRFYVAGKLTRAQRDTNFDGKPDVWEIYEDGKLERIGQDLDHDGHVDRWERDEVTQRLLEQREREQEQEAQKRSQAQSEALDGGATDARVSARRR